MRWSAWECTVYYSHRFSRKPYCKSVKTSGTVWSNDWRLLCQQVQSFILSEKPELNDDELKIAIHGYLHKEGGRIALILAQYDDKHRLVYKGHVTGIGKETFNRISKVPESKCLFRDEISDSNTAAHWIEPVLVCKMAYMELMKSGSMRQPVFRGIREDKMAANCRAANWPQYRQ